MITFIARPFASGYTFLEAPRWHQGHLWVSDYFTRRVLKFDLAGNAVEMALVDGMPSGLGFMPDGTPLVVSQRTHQIFRIRSGGKLELHADLRGISVVATNDDCRRRRLCIRRELGVPPWCRTAAADQARIGDPGRESPRCCRRSDVSEWMRHHARRTQADRRREFCKPPHCIFEGLH